MPRGSRKKRIGTGAICSVLKRILHPSREINNKYPNQQHRERLDELLVTGHELRRVRGKEQLCILFRHADFEGIQLYCQEQYAKVITEGPAEYFFVTQEGVDQEEVHEQQNPQEEQAEEFQLILELVGDLAEDIACLHAEGYGMDDDNEPAPENVPQGANQQEDQPTFQEWGARHACHH